MTSLVENPIMQMSNQAKRSNTISLCMLKAIALQNSHSLSYNEFLLDFFKYIYMNCIVR